MFSRQGIRDRKGCTARRPSIVVGRPVFHVYFVFPGIICSRIPVTLQFHFGLLAKMGFHFFLPAYSILLSLFAGPTHGVPTGKFIPVELGVRDFVPGHRDKSRENAFSCRKRTRFYGRRVSFRKNILFKERLPFWEDAFQKERHRFLGITGFFSFFKERLFLKKVFYLEKTSLFSKDALLKEGTLFDEKNTLLHNILLLIRTTLLHEPFCGIYVHKLDTWVVMLK